MHAPDTDEPSKCPTMAPDMLVLTADDNVATALRDLDAGVEARVFGPDGHLGDLPLKQAIALGHKAALRHLASGEQVIKHGYPIGLTTADIGRGEHVHVHNVISLSRVGEQLEGTGERP
jgi:hypothetical protein